MVATHRDCKPTTLEAMGKVIPVTRCLTTLSNQPGIESVEYLDVNGVPVRSETSMGGIAVIMTAATREEARADRAGPEMMTTTFITPDRPIEKPRATTRGAYRVSTTEGKLPSFPNTGAQKVTPLSFIHI